MLNARPVCDGLVGQSLLVFDWRGDAPGGFDPIEIDLHHAATAVGHQNVILAVLLIDNHINRTIAVAEFGDGLAFDLRAGFQLADGEIHERRASVSSQHMLFFADLERRESPHRGARLKASV